MSIRRTRECLKRKQFDVDKIVFGRGCPTRKSGAIVKTARSGCFNHIRSRTQISKSDQSQLAFAASVGRTIYTYNVGDFTALHSEYLTRETNLSGIIVGEQGRFGIGEQIRRLLRIIEAKSAEEMQNHIEFLSNR